ncbi:MAG TPA: DUF4159 domain-containing protein [Gammaproteobacteria bacterium]
MERRIRLIVAVVMLGTLTSVVFAQRGFRRFFAPAPDGPLVGEPKEWTFARLAYDGAGRGSGWSVDYPGAEYHFSQAVDRLTLIDVHPEGHVVSPNSDDLFDYPWLYAVEVGSWAFSDAQARRMREHLLRGGFLMVDDFHGEYEWQIFMEGMRKIFPDRPIENISEDDPIYTIPYEIGERLQVPGPNYMYSGLTYERVDGVTPHWRGIRDDDGRWMVVISHNVDYGEGWEQADNPAYPEPFTGQAYEVAVDYLVYSMTH